MASLTIEEIKQALTQSGVELPSARGMKKEDYVKLYEEHVTLNDSVGAAYSSDEESSQNNKTNGDWKLITEAVEALSNDDLFNKLKEQGLSVGPILPNTRKVYEKKYLKYLQNENSSNGFHGTDTTVFMDPSEISDNEIEINHPPPRRATPQPSTSKKTPSREPSLAKEPLPPPRRISFIEEIPSGSSRRIIKPIDSFESSLRQRASVSVGGDYVGKWSPKLSTRNVQIEKPKNIPWKRITYLGIAIGVAIVVASLYFGWTPADPYQLIEKEAEEIATQV